MQMIEINNTFQSIDYIIACYTVDKVITYAHNTIINAFLNVDCIL